MAELIVDQEVCRQVPSRQLFENDFEDAIVANRRTIFPDWHLCKFKPLVSAPDSGYGQRRPDLALVEPNFLSWWVVEVELAHHSLQRHVMPQVEVLAQGQYGDEHAHSLSHALSLPADEAALLRNLLRNRQPRVLVIVDSPVPRWRQALTDLAAVMIVTPFADRHGRRRYLTDGDQPERGSQYLSVCTRDPAMPRSVIVRNPDATTFKTGDTVQIRVEGSWTCWRYFMLGANSFLFATGPFPLGQSRDYALGCDNHGELFIRPLTNQIRRSIT